MASPAAEFCWTTTTMPKPTTRPTTPTQLIALLSQSCKHVQPHKAWTCAHSPRAATSASETSSSCAPDLLSGITNSAPNSGMQQRRGPTRTWALRDYRASPLSVTGCMIVIFRLLRATHRLLSHGLFLSMIICIRVCWHFGGVLLVRCGIWRNLRRSVVLGESGLSL